MSLYALCIRDFDALFTRTCNCTHTQPSAGLLFLHDFVTMAVDPMNDLNKLMKKVL